MYFDELTVTAEHHMSQEKQNKTKQTNLHSARNKQPIRKALRKGTQKKENREKNNEHRPKATHQEKKGKKKQQ